jgi:8-amino-7-oxononanoate synthase
MLRPWCDRLFVDQCAHYSVTEAAQHSGLPVHTFGHCDADSLRAALRANSSGGSRPAVLTDGVFSALGHIAPLADYRDVLQDLGLAASAILVDDAHGIGVLGATGKGTLEHAGLMNANAASDSTVNSRLPSDGPVPGPPAVFFYGTLSKAFGGFGGIVPGTLAWIEHLKRTSRYFAGASAPPTPAAAATARAMELVIADPEIRARLRDNVHLLKSGLRGLGLDADETTVPIVSLAIGTAENMQRIQKRLMERGIAIAYFPTYSGLGPEGGLRLAVFATHTETMIRHLLAELAPLL